MLPVGCHVEYAVRFQFFSNELDEIRIDDTAFVVLFFMPGVRKKQLKLADWFVGDLVVKYLDGIMAYDFNVFDTLRVCIMYQVANTRSVYFDADEVGVLPFYNLF